MARHLARNHSIIWEQKQENKIDEYVSSVYMKIDQTQAEKITKKLSFALAQSSAPYRLVDNPSFREAIELLNSNYALPHHQTISRRISDIFKQ